MRKISFTLKQKKNVRFSRTFSIAQRSQRYLDSEIYYALDIRISERKLYNCLLCNLLRKETFFVNIHPGLPTQLI